MVYTNRPYGRVRLKKMSDNSNEEENINVKRHLQ